METAVSARLTLPLLGKVLLVHATDGLRLIRQSHTFLPVHEVEGWFTLLDRRQVPKLREFVARARLAGVALSGLDDDSVTALVRNGLRRGTLVLLAEGEGGDTGQTSETDELRRLVRDIESRTGKRLSAGGRAYRLVVDVDLAVLPGRDSYEVAPHAEAVRVLETVAQSLSANQELRSALLRARDKLTKDWWPPFDPDGLVLLRKTVVHSSSKPDEPSITPSQMKKLIEKDWIEIEVVYDDDDEPYKGPYSLARPDGSKDEGRRFPAGMWSARNIDSGTYNLELREQPGAVADGEAEPGEVEEQKIAKRVRLSGMLFDANKCFLLPQALPGIKQIVAMSEEEPGAEVLIVGHAGGDEDLAGADIAFDRAQMLGAYLMNKPNLWLNWFGPDKSPRSRWGTREIQLMLSTLPEGGETPYYQGNASGVTDPSTTAAITAFQEGAGLSASGKADFDTRKAIVEAYMNLEDTSLGEDVTPIAHGCEGHFDDTETASGMAPDDRRLEVFFFEDKIDPRPSANISSEGSTEYPAWLEQVVKTKDFENHGIHIQIVDSRQQPAPFATVHLQGPTTGEATTDEHGFVTFFGLKPGEYTIRSEKNGYKIGVSKLTYPTAKTVPGYAKTAA